ncbi:MAG: hypothetical protein HC881_02335 [Leptolyngbyaceae cyanobacterium SL_7_1]|nr:hypothetical protein [Leptolyngbyaceae cyanobacterium SL_7_1]
MEPHSTTVLLLSANPRGSSPLRLDEERREIEAGLERSRLKPEVSSKKKQRLGFEPE